MIDTSIERVHQRGPIAMSHSPFTNALQAKDPDSDKSQLRQPNRQTELLFNEPCDGVSNVTEHRDGHKGKQGRR
jgi:hypothetical protein